MSHGRSRRVVMLRPCGRTVRYCQCRRWVLRGPGPITIIYYRRTHGGPIGVKIIIVICRFTNHRAFFFIVTYYNITLWNKYDGGENQLGFTVILYVK